VTGNIANKCKRGDDISNKAEDDPKEEQQDDGDSYDINEEDMVSLVKLLISRHS